MLIDKYTSIKEVIRNVYRNTGREDEINIEDVAYWVYECMENIGYPLQYIPKLKGGNSDEAYVYDAYKIRLPNDFYKLLAVTVNGATAIPSSNTYHNLVTSTCCGFENISSSIDGFFDNFGNFFSPQAPPLTQNTNIQVEQLSFTINESYITFNLKEGTVCMAYLAYPIDDEGFPMIPDNIYYKQACAAFIQERLHYIDWLKQLLPEAVYRDSEKKYYVQLANARNEARMPSLQQMEALKNQQIKMVVRIDEYRNNFRTLGQRGFRGRY